MRSARPSRRNIVAALAVVTGLAMQSAIASDPEPIAAPDVIEVPEPAESASERHWLERFQQRLYSDVWNTAMRVDRLFGSEADERAYQRASGSLAPALLWNEFDGFKPQLRFNVNLPLPQLDERWNAFVGRVNRDEYVTERQQESGAFRRQFGPTGEDQTIFGIAYRETERQGWRFQGGGGVRITLPLDPYVKAGWAYEKGQLGDFVVSLRETLFWQNSERLGFTSRVDVNRLLSERALVRWTLSGTVSQETEGVRGYTALRWVRAFPSRRAIAVEIGADGETDLPVPLREYGVKFAYRKSVWRDWLVLEGRTSLTWPKDLPEQPRAPSWGVGIGFEMFFGTSDFVARPVTF